MTPRGLSLSSLDSAWYLSTHLKEGKELNPGDYSFCPVNQRTWNLDGTYGILLLAHNHPAAVMGYGYDDRTFVINQLQGVEGMQDYLRPLFYRQMLLQIPMDRAYDEGFSRLKVTSARNSKWWEMGAFIAGVPLEVHQRRMLKSLDCTAQDGGMVPDPDGDWILEFKAIKIA